MLESWACGLALSTRMRRAAYGHGAGRRGREPAWTGAIEGGEGGRRALWWVSGQEACLRLWWRGFLRRWQRLLIGGDRKSHRRDPVARKYTELVLLCYAASPHQRHTACSRGWWVWFRFSGCILLRGAVHWTSLIYLRKDIAFIHTSGVASAWSPLSSDLDSHSHTVALSGRHCT